MKTQKVVLIAAFILLFSIVANAQSYTKVVLSQRTTLKEAIVTYSITTFDNTYQIQNWISKLTKSQPNGSTGVLNNSRGNLFLLQENNGDGSATITAYMVFWSTRSQSWHIDAIDISGINHLGEGVTIFSRA
ncbi:hypothetical protein J3L18_22460 [Mucilaginibacter gossypii]|uniref:hypothetical protein n=1 Tax=Mucilaginibacter gossypii TaxID=551996 RepID=UPI000DCB4CA2|nr:MULTISPECIES: hypothetical protein [Mucilaginibacter]QTE35889.1 hypothetical protein J3L18_22460 [Mucilaginibacter gossypii]RAV54695.1 hypothetical protein DIU36_20145 [Mucilaginibacter rubeus]